MRYLFLIRTKTWQVYIYAWGLSCGDFVLGGFCPWGFHLWAFLVYPSPLTRVLPGSLSLYHTIPILTTLRIKAFGNIILFILQSKTKFFFNTFNLWSAKDSDLVESSIFSVITEITCLVYSSVICFYTSHFI